MSGGGDGQEWNGRREWSISSSLPQLYDPAASTPHTTPWPPRDPSGREICLLFHRFGQCRFGTQCTKSHWRVGDPVVKPRRLACHVLVDLVSATTRPSTAAVTSFYRMYGARFNTITERLEFSREAQTPNEKTIFKRMKIEHWRTRQAIREASARQPPVFALKVDPQKISVRRLLPAAYIFMQSALGKPAGECELVRCFAETTVALLHAGVRPQEVERRMREWGIPEVMARRVVLCLWRSIVAATRSPYGFPPLLLRCETAVREGKPEAVLYARACELALPYARAAAASSLSSSSNKSIRSERQGRRRRRSRADRDALWARLKALEAQQKCNE